MSDPRLPALLASLPPVPNTLHSALLSFLDDSSPLLILSDDHVVASPPASIATYIIKVAPIHSMEDIEKLVILRASGLAAVKSIVDSVAIPLASESPQLLSSLSSLSQQLSGVASMPSSITAEQELWKAQNNERAQLFATCLSRFPALDSNSGVSSNTIEDLVELMQELITLEPTHGERYPLQRAFHLVILLTNQLLLHTRHACKDVWHCDMSVLSAQLSLYDQFDKGMLEMDERAASAAWRTALQEGRAKLSEIIKLRTLASQLAHLISSQQMQSFSSLLSTLPSPLVLTAPQFQAYLQPLENELIILDEKALNVIQAKLSSLRDRPEMMISFFQSIHEILQRKTIKVALESDRKTLVMQLMTRVENMKKKFHNEDAIPSETAFLSQIIRQHMAQQQIMTMISVAQQLLNDITGIDRFLKLTSEFQRSIDEKKKELFVNWQEDIKSQLQDKNSELVLQTNGKLMDLDLKKDGSLRVYYSEKLSLLLREVRELKEMGFAIHESIINVTKVGDKYYRYGLKLKQIANFYNTMSEQIIPSQLAMLLFEAQKFEGIIKDQQALSWNKPEECERYIARLEAAAEELTKRNRKLRAEHMTIAQHMVTLFSPTYDFIRNHGGFVEQIQHLRSVIERQNAPEKSLRLWKNHWEQQVYKLYKHQYAYMLEMIIGDGTNTWQNKTSSTSSAATQSELAKLNIPLLAERRIEIKIEKNKLVFKPPLEEIRTKFYNDLNRDYLSLPSRFQCFYDTPSSLFALIPAQLSAALLQVYSASQALFLELENVLKDLSPWSILSRIDEAVVGKLTKTVEWEINFRMLTDKRKESMKIPDTIKIGCFLISLTSFKSSLDMEFDHLKELLYVSLKQSSASHFRDLDAYITSGLKRLNTMPTNAKEMREATTEWMEISNKKPEMEAILSDLLEKDELLKYKAGIFLGSDQLKTQWDEFESNFEKFQNIMQDQKTVLTNEIYTKIQEFQARLDKDKAAWEFNKKDYNNISSLTPQKISDILADLNDWNEKLKALKTEGAELIDQSVVFNLSTVDFPQLTEFESDLVSTNDSWKLYTEYQHDLEEMTKVEWIVFKKQIQTFAQVLERWNQKLKQRGKRDVVYEYLVKEIKINLDLFPTLQMISADFLEPEHFRRLFIILSFSNKITVHNVTFGDFLRANSLMFQPQKKQEIHELIKQAQGEVIIRESMTTLRTWADTKEFKLLEHEIREKKDKTYIIQGYQDLFSSISEQQALLGSLKESPFYDRCQSEAEGLERSFAILDNCLHELNHIQRKYMDLEPIFTRGALPSEQKRFFDVDSRFRALMNEIHHNTNCIQFTKITDLESDITYMTDHLERCQRALNDFLEEKRSKFPRFYFIGDDDLLEILGQATNPSVIQTHLKKLFAGIATVEFSSDMSSIIAMKSSMKETVKLIQPVQVTTDVEDWLAQLSKIMEKTLQRLLVECLKEENISKYPSQILDLAENIHFTLKVEDAIKNNSLPQLHQSLLKQLQRYTSEDINDDSEEALLLQLKIKALVMDLIHNIDVVRQLIEAKVATLDNWMWQKQLRFYMNKDLCVIRMVDAEFHYTYEYQGNVEKLVHTPLSDKCYLVLTQGMHLGYGGCPFGPAGTGKTESVKALGQLFGRQVLVFNCDEGIDFQSMGRIFTGLVKSGAWGCFDEFNRLKEDQLSAVSQQIQVIQAAIKGRQPSCELIGKQVHVNSNAAIFVTMNPASREYGGRSKLPHNLKQLFRDVAMSAPDVSQIAVTILKSEGFLYAEQIGTKVCEVFSSCKELLSRKQHYDWGLRALKTVLRHSGQLIHSEKRRMNGQPVSRETEVSLVIGALKINTLSKLTGSDTKRFHDLIQDVFGDAKVDDVDYTTLTNQIKASLEELKMETGDTQIKKILQLNEALNQRMGVVIVGPSGCGKSVMLNVLHHALGKLGKPIVRHVMNPKALERSKLLGHMDNDTRLWTDGVLTRAARQVMTEPAGTHSWIVSDGDIDPEWIESLNSVLDDNHLLTMPNGDRIKFGSNVNFVFESHDLSFASPATVSRMGMIFLSEEDVDIHALIRSWIKKQDANMQQKLSAWMEELFHMSLNYILELNSDIVKRTKVGIVQSGLSHLKSVTCKAEFILGLIRGMGSNLSHAHRSEFAKKVYEWAHEKPVDSQHILDAFYNKHINSLSSYAFKEQPIPPEQISFRSPPLVNTLDIQRHRDVIAPWLQNMEPFLLVGPEGAGKTLLLEDCFKNLKAKVLVSTIHCSAQTNAQNILQKLAESCTLYSTNKGRVYRPKEGDRLILFFKDLNLPKPDKYDTIQLIAFLQQLITYQGFYDDNLEWISIEKIQIVASMNPSTAMGRHVLSTRFTATIHVASIEYPEPANLKIIYSSFLKTVLSCTSLADNNFKKDQMIAQLTGCILDIYEKCKRAFSADEYRHYLFNPRDLTQWIFGLLRYNLAKEPLLMVVIYESYRLFADRLVSPEALKLFEKILYDTMRNQFRYEGKLTDVYFTSLMNYSVQLNADVNDAPAVAAELTPLLKEMGASLERITPADFKEVVNDGLTTYEREYKTLNILLFPDILDHIAYEERVLSRPGGSLLLIGDAGVGRKTSVALVCHMQRIQMFTLNVNKKYTLKLFRNELKEMLKLAGVEDKNILLYMEDHHIVEPSFLEDINSLLSSGEISGLYTSQELEPLLSPLKEAFVSNGYGFKNVYEFFVSRIRRNFHIVLSMNSTHPLFGIRTESNPAIYSKCTILWLGKWSKLGMNEVAKMRLGPILHSKTSSGQQVDVNRIIDTLLYIHQSCSKRGATPLKYVNFLQNYLQIFNTHQEGLVTQKKHLSAGLQKLTDAAASVDVLSKDASQKKEAVTRKQKEADQALEQITQRMAQAGERKAEVEQLQKVLGGEEAKLNVRKEQIQEELKDIQPILNAAREAVGGIKKDNINEIRAFRMPPAQINAVLCGVLTIMKQEDFSWNNMKKFLGSPSVKEDILNFDVNSVDSVTRSKVVALVQKTPDAFDKVKMMHVNVAAAPLAAWVQAVIRYSEVLEKIRPLRTQFEDANKQLEGARSRLKQCEKDLSDLDQEVQVLKQRFGKTTSEAETLKIALEKTTDILAAAQSLLSKLSGEKNRWESQVHSLSSGLDALTYHAMLAAGFTCYLGASPEDERQESLRHWKEKTGVQDFQFMEFMSTESTFLKWKAEGLPSDTLSMQNGLVIMNSVQVPFIIDPNGSATSWLKNHLSLEKTSLEVVMQQEQRFVSTLELAIRFGKTLIIQEVDGVIPLLYPILRRDLLGAGPRKMVQVGDKLVDWNDSFRIFLMTRDPNPELTNDTLALVNSINFTVTRSGLEGQLLGITLNHEKPKLEQEKSNLLATEDKLKIQLADLEKSLLNELAQSEGNILENKALIDSLNQTKTQSSAIAESLQQSKEIQLDLDRQRDVYRPIAHVGSILYFLVAQLAAVNNMYEFSLPTFVKLFQTNLQNKDIKTSDEAQRVSMLADSLKLLVFTFITRSLFKADRLMFALHFVHCLKPTMFGPNEWEFFTGQVVGEHHDPNISLPVWCSKERHAAFVSFMSVFGTFGKALRFSDEAAWGAWFKHVKPELNFPQSSGERNASLFQQILLIKTFRPDRLQNALFQFACDAIGVSNISPPPLNLNKVLHEVEALEPILFICEGGADPSQEIEEYAAKTIGKNNFFSVALGSGQTDHATDLLQRCAREGQWLCLKNLHLVTPWLYSLEKTLKTIQPKPDFRLILTTESHPSFPPILLQQSLKISYESPPGIKQNLLRTYETWDAAYISKGSVTRAQLLFILAWFHAIVQERRVYIPQGWTKFYEFSFADLRSSADIIDNLFKKFGGGSSSSQDIEPSSFPWLTIWGLFKFAIYGGRIDNDHDVRVLVTYLRKFFAKDILNTGSSPAQRKMTQGLEIPQSNQHGDYKRIIANLSDSDFPALFSLSENIDGSVQENISQQVIVQLRKLSISATSLNRFDRSVWKQQLDPFLSLWDKLWQKYANKDSRFANRPEKLKKDEARYTPLEAFVTLENQKVYELMSLVKSAITDLAGVLNQGNLLTSDIKNDGTALLSGQVPWRWCKSWYGPSDPSTWVSELLARRAAMLQLIDRTNNNQLLTQALYMSQLFTPKVFLNALRQQTARTMRKQLDELKLVASFDPNAFRSANTIPVTLDALLLQGCDFSGNVLGPLRSDAPSTLTLPPCTIAYIPSSDPEPYGEANSSLAVPVYVSSSREEYVCELKIPCKGQLDRWILSGVAIFLSDYK